MICFGPESALHLAQGLEGRVQHFLSCGTIWVHGHSVEVPTVEEAPRAPFGEYGVRKAAMEAALLDFARRRGFPATVLHPGHIVGRGWVPLNPAGNFNPEVFAAIARGQTLTLPNLGLETVHHVHADDVAQGFVRALGARQASAGESFHLVSPAALTLRGYRRADVRLVRPPARPGLPALGAMAADRERGGRPAAPGTTSPTAPAARSARPSGSWATSPATPPWRR